MPGAGPRFWPEGEWVLIPSPTRGPGGHVLSAATGERIRVLAGAREETAGIEITQRGIAYAWDSLGTVTAWDVASGSLLRQFSLTCSPENMGS